MLAKSHRVKAKPKPLIPILAGANPPRLPMEMGTKPSAVARQIWGTYWTCLLMPWRNKSDFLPTDAADVLQVPASRRPSPIDQNHVYSRSVLARMWLGAEVGFAVGNRRRVWRWSGCSRCSHRAVPKCCRWIYVLTFLFGRFFSPRCVVEYLGRYVYQTSLFCFSPV